MATLSGINMVILCHQYFLVHIARRFNGRVYGGRYDGVRAGR